MFTGIVEQQGKVVSLVRKSKKSVLRIAVPMRLRKGLHRGDSVSVNGVCLTVRSCANAWIESDLLRETLRRSNLADVACGSLVNLERCLKVTSRVGGHFLTGHVDATGKVLGIVQRGVDRIITLGYPACFSKYLVEKGSIGVDGVSLTVVKATPKLFTVHLIAHTLSNTTLGHCKTGDKVNLEFDIMAKYLWKWMKKRLGNS